MWLVLTLFVASAPLVVNCELTLVPANLTVVEGANANLNCSPLSEDIVLSSIAPGSDVPVVITTDNPRLIINDTNGARLFTWLNASRSDDGRKFSCSSNSNMSDTSTLTVHYDVSVQVLGANFTAMIGHDFNVLISVDGNPTPTVEWTLDGDVIESTPRRTANISGLFLEPSYFGDFGRYAVTATNNISSAIAAFFVATSARLPDFIAINSNKLAVKLGDILIINCTVSADFMVNLSLTKDGSLLESITSDKLAYTVSDSAQGSDAGEYVCKAAYGGTTQSGSVSIKVAVEVGDIPGAVDNIEIVKEEADVFLIKWNAAEKNGVNITDYEVSISHNERLVFIDYVIETNTTVTLDDLNIPRDAGEVDLVISVTAINGLGRGETVTVEDTLTVGSSSRPGVTQPLISVLLLVACVLSMAL